MKKATVIYINYEESATLCCPGGVAGNNLRFLQVDASADCQERIIVSHNGTHRQVDTLRAQGSLPLLAKSGGPRPHRRGRSRKESELMCDFTTQIFKKQYINNI